jgi:hypothetical protein
MFRVSLLVCLLVSHSVSQLVTVEHDILTYWNLKMQHTAGSILMLVIRSAILCVFEQPHLYCIT